MYIIYCHIECDAEILSVANEPSRHHCISVRVNASASYTTTRCPYSEITLLGTK